MGRGVIARRPVDRPIHRILGIKGFPRTDVAVREAVSIPCYPALSDGEVARVIEAVRAAFGASEKGWLSSAAEVDGILGMLRAGRGA